MITLVEPSGLKRSIFPVLPTLTTTRLGTVSPGTQFRSEALGRVAPSGHTVRKLEAVVSVTVTFSTTAVGATEAFISGTPPRPATVAAIVALGPSGAAKPPV